MARYFKYHNKPCDYDGHHFDSTSERDRYIFLRRKEAEGEIQDLKLQVEFELLPRQSKLVTVVMKTKTKMVDKFLHHPVSYFADFTYLRKGELVVEDVKGNRRNVTDEFRLKSKMMTFFHDIIIKCIYKENITTLD